MSRETKHKLKKEADANSRSALFVIGIILLFFVGLLTLLYFIGGGK